MGAGAAVFVVIVVGLVVVMLARPGWASKAWHLFDAPKNESTTPPPTDPVPSQQDGQASVVPNKSVAVMVWAWDGWGEEEAVDDRVLAQYLAVLEPADAVFLTGIRDPSGLALKRLCDHLPAFSCRASLPGPLPVKEAYGLLWRSDAVRLTDWTEFGPDDRWDHPPVKIGLASATDPDPNASLLIYMLHTDPGDVARELRALEASINPRAAATLIVGSLNADCAYYDRTTTPTFSDWTWNPAQPTIRRAPCAYDRLLSNPEATRRLGPVDVKTDTPELLGSHYPITTTYQFP